MVLTEFATLALLFTVAESKLGERVPELSVNADK